MRYDTGDETYSRSSGRWRLFPPALLAWSTCTVNRPKSVGLSFPDQICACVPRSCGGAHGKERPTRSSKKGRLDSSLGLETSAMLLLCLTPSVFGGVCVYAPGQQVFWTFFSVLGGGLYFDEFHTRRFVCADGEIEGRPTGRRSGEGEGRGGQHRRHKHQRRQRWRGRRRDEATSRSTMVGLTKAGEDIRLVRTRCVRAFAVKGLLFLAGVHGFLGVGVVVCGPWSCAAPITNPDLLRCERALRVDVPSARKELI